MKVDMYRLDDGVATRYVEVFVDDIDDARVLESALAERWHMDAYDDGGNLVWLGDNAAGRAETSDGFVVLCGNCGAVLRVEPAEAQDQVLDYPEWSEVLECECGAPVDGTRVLVEVTL